MTDKELKKLSRLELLELLLEESRENERLKVELGKLRSENDVAKSVEHLSEMTKCMDSCLQSANLLTDQLRKITVQGITVNAPQSIPAASPVVSVQYRSDEEQLEKQKQENEKAYDNSADMKLYRRLMLHYSQNADSLSFLPADIQKDVVNRVREIIHSRN